MNVDDVSRLELLLGDIRDAFAKKGGVEISSADLVKALVAIKGRPWAGDKPMTQKKLAQMLKPLAIAVGRIGTRVRGYKLWQFEEAFSRLPSNAANTDNGGGRGLSSRRLQELADWYSDQAYWHYSPSALAAGALDAELRALLRQEVVSEAVETEFKRVRSIRCCFPTWRY